MMPIRCKGWRGQTRQGPRGKRMNQRWRMRLRKNTSITVEVEWQEMGEEEEGGKEEEGGAEEEGAKPIEKPNKLRKVQIKLETKADQRNKPTQGRGLQENCRIRAKIPVFSFLL
jgi:hypothetical protein